MVHFPTCSLHIAKERFSVVVVNYAGHIEILIEEFNKRLPLSCEEDLQVKLIEDPFSIDPGKVPTHVQLEVVDLQSSLVHKTRHRGGRLQDFYRGLNKEKYKNLLDLAKRIFSLFGSTYMSEQTFSVLNFNKNKRRSSFTDGYLGNILKIASSSMDPEYEKLVTNKRCNFSH